MSSLFGTIEPFDLKEGDFVEYTERLDQYFVANKIEDAAQKRAIFITLIGNDAYSLLRSLLSPVKPNTKTYTELVTTLTDHLKPKPVIIAERYKFYERIQNTDESISEFIAALRKLSIKCEFREFLNEALRDKLVCGLRNGKVRKRLLIEKDLTLDKAIEISKSLGGVEIEFREMEKSTAVEVKTETAFQMKRSEVKSKTKKCYRCDDESHLANQCRYISTVCSFCKGPGHISRACRKRKKKVQTEKSNKEKDGSKEESVHNIPRDPDDDADTESNFFLIHHMNDKSNPYQVKLNVNGHPIVFEIDTGAGVSIISSDTYLKHFKECKLLPTNVRIRTYSNESLQIQGKLEVLVNSRYKVILYVIEGSGTSLMGRDWLHEIKIDWADVFTNHVRKVNSVEIKRSSDPSTKPLNDILKKHGSLFEDRIGRMKGYKAEIHLKENASPKFMKSRVVPFALQDPVGDEIDKLLREGVWKNIPFSNWASPIVVIPKSDGSVRICGDYKHTVNPCIENHTYPTPSNDEVFAKMEGGKKFSKIDLRQAYLQIELDDNAKKLLVVNTSRGLMEPQTMPYGMKPASGIFQAHIENALVGCKMAAVRTDDILVTGRNDKEHLENLDSILTALSKLGVTLKKKKCKFLMNEVEHLGLIISAEGIRVNPEKTEAVL